jgi:hypothetical protein
MNIALYVAMSFLIGALMYVIFHRRSPHIGKIRLEDLNLAALANLMDPAEQKYLHQELSGPDFRRLHRRRMRVALAYLSELQDALPTASDSQTHATLSRTRLLIMELRCRAVLSYVLPHMRVSAAKLPQLITQVVPSNR